MPKILQISVAVAKGSQGKIPDRIGSLAMENGWESWIAYSAHNGYHNTKSSVVEIGNNPDFYEHAFESRLFDNHGLASRRPTRELIRKMDIIKPDIIHLHNIHGYYLNYRFLFEYLAEKGIPVVWTLHDCWSMTGHCAHYVTANCNRWKTGCYECPLKKDYPASWLLDRSERNWNIKQRLFTSVENLTIVPVSHWLESVVRESYLSRFPIRVIRNGIDLNVFKPQNTDRSSRNDRFTILGVGNILTRDKGLYEFIGLSENPDYQVVLVGGRPEDSKHIPRSIVHIPHTSNQEELAKLYASADVLVNPTYADSFPTVNIESIACGTPVITYSTGGAPEILDSNSGIVVPCGDMSALTEAVETIRLMPQDEKEAMSRHCVERARKLFNDKERFSEYIDLYSSLI